MTKVRLINNLKEKVRVQEGNAGVYTTRATLDANGHFDLDIDKNATYREYILIILPDNSELDPISSDDITDYESIVIEKNQRTGKVGWRGVRPQGFSLSKLKFLMFWR
jgi:hypothetical protein